MNFDEALPRLVASYDQGLLTPFVGLGVSVGTCSQWRDLIVNLSEEARQQGLGVFPDINAVPEPELPKWANRIVALLRRNDPTAFPDVMRKALYAKKPSDPMFITDAVNELANV